MPALPDRLAPAARGHRSQVRALVGAAFRHAPQGGRRADLAITLGSLGALALGTVALGALVAMAGCGGGGGDSGSALVGSGTTTTTTAAAYTEGTVSGFGSIIVNGVRFDDSAVSAVNDDGAPTTVKLGAHVEVVSASVDDSTATAVAQAVHVRANLLGPVSSVGSTSFVALGQTVDVTDTTVFDSTLASGIASLVAGTTVVEVHGLVDSTTGHLLATRVEAKTGVTAYVLRGTVAGLDTTATTFTVNGATINYGTVSSVPTTLANGSTVRVVLATSTNSAGQWVATAFGSAKRNAADGQAARVHGTITAYTSATSFSVNGLAVDASGVASLPSGLALGVEVDVKGTLTNGVLVATAVTLKAETRVSNGSGDSGEHGTHAAQRFELHGAISALDTTAQTFTLRGITVDYSSSTLTWLPSGKTAADLVNGVRIEVLGTLGNNRSTLTATTVKFEN